MPLGLAALDDLFAAFDGLRDALTGSDVSAIEQASDRVSRAAAGVRAQAESMNPMFRNTRLPRGTMTKSHAGFPCILEPNTNTPTERMMAACTIASTKWAAISLAKYFQIGSGVTSNLFNMDWFR